MKKSLYLLFVLVCAGLLFAACSGENPAADESAGQLERPEPPPEYAGLANPLNPDSTQVESGQALFQKNCVSCHGVEGKGDGPAASALNPKPADLVQAQAELSDGYLFWRIAEGGQRAPFHSTMPAWKGILKDDQIWQMIAFLRNTE